MLRSKWTNIRGFVFNGNKTLIKGGKAFGYWPGTLMSSLSSWMRGRTYLIILTFLPSKTWGQEVTIAWGGQSNGDVVGVRNRVLPFMTSPFTSDPWRPKVFPIMMTVQIGRTAGPGRDSTFNSTREASGCDRYFVWLFGGCNHLRNHWFFFLLLSTLLKAAGSHDQSPMTNQLV